MGRFRKMLYKISTNIKVFLFVVLFTFVSTVSHAVDLSKNYETVAKSVFIVHTLETYKPVLEGKFSDDSPFKSLEKLPKEMPEPQSLGKGTGFLISKEGYVVTNDHVVAPGSKYVLVDSDGKEYDATLIGKDKFTDLAVLQINDVDSIQHKEPVVFSELDPKVGHPIYIIGHPINMSFVLSTGHVTAVDTNKRKYSKFIQTDAVVNKGNSGGPMFNYNNEVVGVITALISPTGYYIGYGYATPPSVATEIITEIIDKGYIWRPQIGFTILDINDSTKNYIPDLYQNTEGVYISLIQPNSPAQEAGILPGDVILTVNGKKATVEGLINVINALKELDQVELTILRISSNTTYTKKLLAKNKE